MQKWVENCRVETGFDKKEYANVEDLIGDPESQKLFLCVANKGNMLDDTGALKRDSVKEVLPKVVKELPLVETLLDDCLIRKDTPGETVFQAFICIEKRIYYMMNGKTLNI